MDFGAEAILNSFCCCSVRCVILPCPRYYIARPPVNYTYFRSFFYFTCQFYGSLIINLIKNKQKDRRVRIFHVSNIHKHATLGGSAGCVTTRRACARMHECFVELAEAHIGLLLPTDAAGGCCSFLRFRLQNVCRCRSFIYSLFITRLPALIISVSRRFNRFFFFLSIVTSWLWGKIFQLKQKMWNFFFNSGVSLFKMLYILERHKFLGELEILRSRRNLYFFRVVNLNYFKFHLR